MSSHFSESAVRPDYDPVIKDIAAYIHTPPAFSDVAYETARLVLVDSIGCALESLKFPECTGLLGPIVAGAELPKGARVPGTKFSLDPVRATFNLGAMVRWLDFNDCFLAREWNHPSDNLCAILSVMDFLSRSTNGAHTFTVKDVLEFLIQAHEIQGCLALLNSFNRVGLDHVILVKVASTAVVSKILGLSESQTQAALSHALVDGQSLRTYRHAPNTLSRKSWAAGDAASRAVWLCLMVQRGENGLPSAVSVPTWGFKDVLFKGKEFEFDRPYGSYIMENILFKISFPAEFHAQTAVECSLAIHSKLGLINKTADDIVKINIKTTEAGMRIINKEGPLDNFADRDHCIQYMVAIPLLFGRLTGEDYTDSVAVDPRIDRLRSKMVVEEEESFSSDYLHGELRSIANAVSVTLKDGSVISEVCEYPVGHKRRRAEGVPLLIKKFERHLQPHFTPERREDILKKLISSTVAEVSTMNVSDFMGLFWEGKD